MHEDSDYKNFSNNNSVYNLIDNPSACATWKVANYWSAALELFGRPYPLHQIIHLPPEYKCFCTDDKYQYYIHDSERYIIMEQWPLYDYSEFWSFMKNYPDYEKCIVAIDDIVRHDYTIRQKLSSQAIQRIHNEVQRIMHQQCKEKCDSVLLRKKHLQLNHFNFIRKSLSLMNY